MKVKWEIEDGYRRGSRPQITEVDDQDLEDCESDDERERLIDEYIQDDFNQKITWHRL